MPKQRITLTPEQISECLRIRATGYKGRMDWTRVAEAIGIPSSRVRAHFEVGYLEKKRLYRQAAQRALFDGLPDKEIRIGRPPREVLLERDRYLSLRHQSLTAAVFGDPLPGHSAYDRKLMGKNG